MKRSKNKIEKDREELKELIIKEFSNIEFQVRDVYYKKQKVFHRGKMQMLFTDVVQLTKDGFLEYSLKKVLHIKDKRNRAVYKLKKKEEE